MEIQELTGRIKSLTAAAGFHKTGIAPVKRPKHAPYLKTWLAQERHGAMHWMERYSEKRGDVSKLWPPAQSVICVAHNYYSPQKHSDETNHAKISRYAWGRDYHKMIKKKLKNVLQELKKIDSSVEGRLFVDTAPIQEKLWAQEAGIGWQGKNTNVLSREYGSWLFLGELLINKILIYDEPAVDHCGGCTACIDACPTNALEPYRIDARRCISYLTIEYRDKPIPAEFRDKLHNWVFGCDICQDVCPWNRFAVETNEPQYHPAEGNVAPDLQSLAQLTEADFKKRFKHSPVWRAKFKNFIRNVKTVIQFAMKG